MKLANALGGGLAGVTTISLIGETLRKLDRNRSHGSFLNGGRLGRRFKKAASKKRGKATKQYIRLAGELLGSSAFLGLASLGKKKNAVLRGAMLGALAGLGTVLLSEEKKKKGSVNGYDGIAVLGVKDPLFSKALEVALFAAGGAVAGKLIQGAGKKKKKK